MAEHDDGKPRPKPTGKKKPASKNEKPQSERFIETARMLSANEDADVFDEKFRRIIAVKAPENR